MSGPPDAYKYPLEIQNISRFICQCLITMINDYTNSINNQIDIFEVYNNSRYECETKTPLANYCENSLSLNISFNTTYENCRLNYLNFCSEYNSENSTAADTYNRQKREGAIMFLTVFCIMGCFACLAFAGDNSGREYDAHWRMPPINLGPASAMNSFNFRLNIIEYVNERINNLGVEGLDEVIVEDEDLSCVICLDRFAEDRQNPAVALECGHIFHRSCLLPWFQEHQSCPTCRAEQFV